MAAGDRLRHSKFVGLRDDKYPRAVVKESPENNESAKIEKARLYAKGLVRKSQSHD
jgi:hypothetical protein